jgi:AcrR family transcriptional regulator
MPQPPTKKHILESTLTAIEKFGYQNITTRVIAKEAGVNNAAIHYYYGTKEKLVDEALAMTLDHMLEDSSEILSRPSNLENRLIWLFQYLVEGIQRFPNLIRAHLNGPLMEGRKDSPFITMMDRWIQLILVEFGDELSEEKKKQISQNIFSSMITILMTGMLPKSPGGYGFIQLSDPMIRSQYIQKIVQSILHDSV